VTTGGVRYRVVGFSISHTALARLVERAGLGRAVTRRAVAGIEGAVAGDIYVGSDGLLWRTTADVAESSGGIQFSLHLATTYSDYGVAVAVSPPPAGDVRILPFCTDPLTVVSPSGNTSAP
jgi:hypothetical protein